MLEELNNIDWANLLDACGQATVLPSFIRALASEDESTQDAALEEIWDHIWHHGRITEATPYAVPFLIELLASGKPRSKLCEVLELLYYIGDGPTPWAREITNLKTYGETVEYEALVLLDREEDLSREEIDAVFRQAEVYIKQSHIAVRKGLPVYLRLLQVSNNPVARENCAWLTAIFPECVGKIAQSLPPLIRKEEDIIAKATLIWSLGRLVGNDNEYLPLFAELSFTPSHPLIYFHAAAAYTNIAGKDTPLDIAALVATGIYWKDWGHIPFIRGSALLETSVHGCRALSKLGPEDAIPVLSRVLRRLADIKKREQHEPFEIIKDTLLNLAFTRREPNQPAARRWLEGDERVNGRRYTLEYEDAPRPVRRLSKLQREVLSSFVATDRLWDRYDNVYALYGLPSTR